MTGYASLPEPLLTASSARQALVVEDNPAFQALIVEAFSELDACWQVCCAETGAAARVMLASPDFHPEIMLTDIGLPDTSGIEVIHFAHERFPEMPIMVISVIASNDSLTKAIHAGARGYLQKGDSALSIASAIGKVLEGDYPISASLARHLFKLVTQGNPDLIDPKGPLTPREVELLGLLGQGYSNAEVAQALHIALSTVQGHTKNIYQKLEVHSRTKAIAKAQARGWI